MKKFYNIYIYTHLCIPFPIRSEISDWKWDTQQQSWRSCASVLYAEDPEQNGN